MGKMCPLLMLARKASTKCPGEKCAWFVSHTNPKAEECAIKELSDNLKYISMRIAELPFK